MTNLSIRQSVTGEARGPLCGMGICFECRDAHNQRTCQLPKAPARPLSTATALPPATALPSRGTLWVRKGAVSLPPIIIIGAGPAGIAAALKLRELNQPFTILDDNPTAGGQIWRGDQARTNLLGPDLRTTTRVISIDPKAHTVLLEDAEGSYQLPWTKLILATGSRELFLPFPGWTLPGVFGAGGLQALVKSGLNVQGKRIIVAGTGPLLLAVAALLRTKGADVRLIAEQAPLTSLTPFAAALLRRPSKLLQGAGLGWTLAGVPYRTNTWVTAAEGTTNLESVTLNHNGQTTTEPCDYAAIGYGLIPNLELQTLAGDSPDIITAQTGDVQLASLAGAAAACQAVGQPCNKSPLTDALDFDAALTRAFNLRPELRYLAAPETFVCRCEDVTYSRLAEWTSFRAAKLQTRCGMGPCQGRVCGAAAHFLFGWTDTSVRPPAFPARIATLAKTEGDL